VQKNHPTVGRIPNGAIVEHEAPGEVVCRGQLSLLLRDADFLTANGVARAINEKFPYSALAMNAGTVRVQVPPEYLANSVGFANEISLLEVPPDAPARVVINERTGTIVAGEQVKISMLGIAHGSLAILTSEEPQVSQPAPFSQGKTTVVPRTNVGVTEQP